MTYALKPRPRAAKQDYGTPMAFIRAVEKRFGPLRFDLAAHEGNAKADFYYSEQDDSLKQSWHKQKGNLWLNPPFSSIGKWAKKCKEESDLGATIYMLVPVNAAAWFRKWCWQQAGVYELVGRIQFEGAKWRYPKDCRLIEFLPPQKRMAEFYESEPWEFWNWETDERFA